MAISVQALMTPVMMRTLHGHHDHHAESRVHKMKSTTPNLRIRSAISIPKLPNGKQLKELNMSNVLLRDSRKVPLLDNDSIRVSSPKDTKAVDSNSSTLLTRKLHVILEVVNDRIEMHQNIKEQRENWNSLLLNSLNMVTLTAVTMSGLAGFGLGGHCLPLKVASTLLFSSATGILLIMNKIQPSQLVEEQRMAVRLFKQIQTRIQSRLSLGTTFMERDIESLMEEVLALDRAYPLPLLGAMLDKFPKTFKPAKWGPSSKRQSSNHGKTFFRMNTNGWSEDLEEEMKKIVGVIKRKDLEDYDRLGNNALKLSKTLAMLGPMLTGLAAIGSAFIGQGGPWGGLVAALAGSMASIVNSIEHGGQVGMVFEMYRNCAGFFTLLEERVESTLEEKDCQERENGELFEMKMALHLGRSLSELRDLAAKSKFSSSFGGSFESTEFASKLF